MDWLIDVDVMVLHCWFVSMFRDRLPLIQMMLWIHELVRVMQWQVGLKSWVDSMLIEMNWLDIMLVIVSMIKLRSEQLFHNSMCRMLLDQRDLMLLDNLFMMFLLLNLLNFSQEIFDVLFLLCLKESDFLVMHRNGHLNVLHFKHLFLEVSFFAVAMDVTLSFC